jgi:hypothetical protein
MERLAGTEGRLLDTQELAAIWDGWKGARR